MNQDHSNFFPEPEDESQETSPLESMIAQVASLHVPGQQNSAAVIQLQDQEEDQEKEDDAFRTIGEVAEMLDVPVHVVRFWRARFGEIGPIKGISGRRYYREEDIEFLRGLRRLLHEEGYAIKGVHRLIRKKGAEFVRAKGTRATQNHDEPIDQILYGLVADLEQIKERLQKFAA